MKFDLHCHSYFSDGTLSPSQLIDHAIDSGVTHLALTDHDTVSGLESAVLAASKSDLTLIPGVEFSCLWQHQLLHIVGLSVDQENSFMLDGIQSNTDRRFERAEKMYQDFERNDIDLRSDVQTQIAGKGVPTRPHFAQALVNQGYAKNKKQAFKRYLIKGKVGYIPMQWPSLEQVANWINQAGGVAVLAHPMRYKFTRSRLIRLIEEMTSVGVRGMEVSTPINDNQQIEMLTRLALDYDLLASIGSDFHSPDQPWARLGTAVPLANELTPVWTEFNHA